MAINYNVWDTVLAVVGMAVISTIYHSNDMVWFVVGAVLAVVYAGVLNRKVIKKAWGKIARATK